MIVISENRRLTRRTSALVCILALLMLLGSLAACNGAKQDRDTLYQVSTLDSLMSGSFDGWTTLDQLAKHGDFGLGTFDKLDGEMVVLDGVIYQVSSDGAIHKPVSTVTTPFAAVTFFDKDKTAEIGSETSLTKLKDILDSMLPSKNLFYAVRIEGIFTSVKTRSVPRQSKPYPLLTDVTAKQPTFQLTNVRGTIIALRCPYFVEGANLPGYHVHFITEDRKHGGHLLDCSAKSGRITVDITTRLDLCLPTDESFYRADFQPASQESVKKAEQGK